MGSLSRSVAEGLLRKIYEASDVLSVGRNDSQKASYDASSSWTRKQLQKKNKNDSVALWIKRGATATILHIYAHIYICTTTNDRVSFHPTIDFTEREHKIADRKDRI